MNRLQDTRRRRRRRRSRTLVAVSKSSRCFAIKPRTSTGNIRRVFPPSWTPTKDLKPLVYTDRLHALSRTASIRLHKRMIYGRELRRQLSARTLPQTCRTVRRHPNLWDARNHPTQQQPQHQAGGHEQQVQVHSPR